MAFLRETNHGTPTACLVRLLSFAGLLALLSFSGCGSKTGLGIPEPSPPDATIPPMDAPMDVPIDIEPPPCTVFGATAELLPLDVFMLFDASGSMHEPTAGGITKWTAVRRAIRSFFVDPSSDGIGVALTFFPQVQLDVPLVCEVDAACGMAGACDPGKACLEAGVLCNTTTDCVTRGFPDDTCVDIGFCPGIGIETSACTFDGLFPCPAGTGPCQPLGICGNRDNCDDAAYGTPAVGIERLPDGSTALLTTFDAHEVAREEAGGTPTLPAVVGTVGGAVSWARDNPDHKVVVVLATDGFPTSCDPDLRRSFEAGLGNVAEAAGGGVDEAGVQTFVIGVFGPEEREFAQMSLDQIAAAGGTTSAFVVNTAGGTTSEFLEALNQVRLDATACDFALSEPIPLTGEPIWARITRDGRETWIPQVTGPEACGAGGFYLPEPTDVAVRIALCPTSCALLGASPDRELELLTTCPEDPTGP